MYKNKYIYLGIGAVLLFIFGIIVYSRNSNGIFHKQYFGKWEFKGKIENNSIVSLGKSANSLFVEMNNGTEKLGFSKKFSNPRITQENGKIIFTTSENPYKIIYQMTKNGIKEEIVIPEKNSLQKEYIFELDVNGLIYKNRDDDSLGFYKKDDPSFLNPIYIIPKLFMFDAKNIRSEKIEVLLSKKEKKIVMTIIPDFSWLNDKNRVYPVTIDPTIESVKNPTAYWKFNEGQGTTTIDSSPNKYLGTLSGTTKPTWQTEDLCISGKCLYYNGSTAYVNTVDIDALDGVTNFSISSWVKFNTLSDWATILSKYGTASTNIAVQLGASGYGDNNDINVALMNGVMNTQGYTTDNSISINNWYFITVTYDGTQSTNETKLKVFINGVQKTLSFNGTIPTTSPNNSSVVTIGQENNAAYINGFIDEIKIYNYTRSTAEVKADYNSRGSVKGVAASMGGGEMSYLSKGLVGYWKMDETSWTNDCSTDSANDSSGNAKHGDSCPATTGPSGGAAGKYGNSGNFDGTEEFLNMGNQSIYDFGDGQDFTISAWINRETYTNNHSIIAKRNGVGASAAGYNLWIDNNTDDFRFEVSDATNEYQLQSNTTVTSAGWYHVTVVFDEDSTNNTQIYINGVKDTNSVTGTLSSVASLSTTRCLTVGGFASNAGCTTAGYPFDGSIDEVRIYNRAMSPTEVSKLYNWAPGPVGYWKLEEGSGSTVADSSGNSNDGTLGCNGDGCALPLWTTGKFGKGLNFDTCPGSSDRWINAGSGPTIDNVWDNGGTVSFWINPRTGASQVFNKNNDTWWISHPTSGDYALIQFRQEFATGSYQWETGYVVPLNSWSFIAVTYNSDSLSNDPMIYLNGQAQTVTQSGTASGTRENDSGGNLSIGDWGWHNNCGNQFVGLLDDIRIYNYTSTQKQVVEDMNAGHPAPGSPVGSALGYWKMDEGSGNTINNIGNGGSTLNGSFTVGSTAPRWTNDGKQGKALAFDGTSDFATVPYNAALKMSGEQTVSFWWKPSINWNATTPAGQDGALLSLSGNSADAGNDWAVFMFNGLSCNDDDGRIRFGTYGGNIQTATNSWSAGQWYHVAVSYTDANNATIYVNGRANNYNNDYAAGAIDGSNNNDLQIGRAYYDCSGVLTGYTPATIDNVKIFASALTADQIKQEYNSAQSLVMGAVSDTSLLTGGLVASNSASAAYCVPDDTVTCSPPVGEWKLEEKIDVTANDSSGNGNTGTLTNGPVWTNGKIGAGVRIDNNNDYITTGNVFDPTGAYTVSMWAYLNTTNTDDTFFSSSTSNSNTLLALYIGDGANNNLVYCSGGSCLSTASSSNSVLTDGTWQYISFTYDGNGTAAFYVNGRNVTSDSSTSELADTGNKIFGNYDTDTNVAIDGILDEIRVYNYARTPAQIAWDYNRGASLAHWKFDECQGTTINDSSGNRNIGTWSGPGGSQTSVGTCTTPASTAWYNGRDGKFNSSLDFDGFDDIINAGSANVVDDLGPYSISFWMKPDTNAAGYIISKRDGSCTGPWRIDASTGTISWFKTGTGTDVDITASNSYTDGVWNHVVITWDGTIYSSGAKLYVNAKLISTTGNNAGSPLLSDAGCSLYIGDRSNNTAPFEGQIDEIKIFNYILTGAQIRNEFNQNSGVRFGPITGTP